MLREVFIAVGLDVGLWHDGGEGHRKVIQDRSVGLCAVDDDGVVTGDLHTLDKVDDVVDIVRGDRTIKRPLDILNGQVASIVELDALADGKLPIRVVELLITLSKQRLGFAVTDDFHQRAENIASDRNGGSFLTDVRIHRGHVCGLRPNDGVLVVAAAFCLLGVLGGGIGAVILVAVG